MVRSPHTDTKGLERGQPGFGEAVVQHLMAAIGIEIQAWEQGGQSAADACHRLGLLVRAARATLAVPDESQRHESPRHEGQRP